ncbi:uncharacterized protein LOC124368348 [Homalodisca vitripennis]|uniref:uncharacterized protein LOC124368348 n=1 Tax=Homalodisca vitripennis TaxID=197043 RepID=UPI001EEA4355|nr:uncharacterized protein LOC124368348 [Homalodisca vitripennis]
MKPSVWRASATFIILVYLYVLAVQEILGEEVVVTSSHLAGPAYHTGPALQHTGPASHQTAPISHQDDYVRNHHKLDENGNSQTHQYVKGVAFEATVEDPDVPATRAVGGPSYRPYNVDYTPGTATGTALDDGYGLEFKYHNYDQLTRYLRTTSSRYPNLTALYSIGKSVQEMKPIGSLVQRARGVIEPLYLYKVGRRANGPRPLYRLSLFQ